jgi:hypothetical protein
VGKLFSDFRISLTEDVNFSIRDLVYFNEDALNESKTKVENYRQKHFKDGWENIQIAPPPENDSDRTKQELVEITKLQQERTKEDENSIAVSDMMDSFHFREYLNENNLEYKSSELSAIIEDVWKITRTFKNTFNRPRPYQVAKALNMNFDTMYGESMATPSYPSGHSVGTRLTAEYLSQKHPAHRTQLMEIAEKVGVGRIQAGFHYRSDHEAGKELAIKVLPFLEISKENLNESIIDLPRKDYSRTVFDNYNTEKPVLKPFVKKMIEDQIRAFNKVAPVMKYRLIGSILTKRYRKDADLDINVLFDVPESDQEEIADKLRAIVREVNGQNVPGSVHPVNYFVIVNRDIYTKANLMADDVYDIVHDRFEKRTQSKPFDIEDYMKEFRARVAKIDIAKGEFSRDLIDYKELIELDDDDIENLKDKLEGKVKELEDDINTLIDMKNNALDKRKSGFDGEMTPEKIKKYGVANRLPNNVVYKMLEKYYYFEFINKLKEIIGDDRKLSDKEADSLMSVGEAVDRLNTIVFAFGRFNPPTIGHGKLMNTVKTKARSLGANHEVFASASSDPRKNPLDQSTKVKYMKKMFKGITIKPAQGNQRTFMEILKTYDKMYGNVIMVAGSDRINEFQKLADKYNGKDYDFKSIKVVSAGDRDPDAEGATGMSASKMRDAAKNNDLKSFSMGIGKLLANNDTKSLFDTVRKDMGIKEGIETFADFLNNDIREDYLKEKVFNIGDMVNNIEDGTSGMVVRRGPNYVVYETDEQEVKKAWLYDLVETKEESNANIETNKEIKRISELPNNASDRNQDESRGRSTRTSISERQTDNNSRELSTHMVEDTKTEGPQEAESTNEETSKFLERLEVEFSLPKGRTTDWIRSKTVDRKQINHGINTFKSKMSAVKDKFALAADIAQKLGIGLREFQTALQSIKLLPEENEESYEIGTIEYAKHAFELTPGQNIKNYRKTTKQIKKEDVKKWSLEESTMHKYKERYKRSWKTELKKSVKRMLDEI